MLAETTPELELATLIRQASTREERMDALRTLIDYHLSPPSSNEVGTDIAIQRAKFVFTPALNDTVWAATTLVYAQCAAQDKYNSARTAEKVHGCPCWTEKRGPSSCIVHDTFIWPTRSWETIDDLFKD